MLKRILPTALAVTLALAGFGANAQSAPGVSRNWCGTDAAREQYFAEHPGAREAQKAFDRQLTVMAEAQMNKATYVTDVTIPVVVHVFHAGGPENITDRQINSAIAQLNLDYQKLNPDTAAIIPLFRPIAASVGFQFRLAKKDPNGNCTTGITRHYSPSLVTDYGSGAVQAAANWDRSRYLNIWVVGNIASGAAGYVRPPNTPTNAGDGFLVLHNYFGTQGTSNLFRGRAPTHEIGHYFSLLHPWGATNNAGTGDCSGTDLVADTPPTDGSLTCDLNRATCGPIANVQNYMDYSYCSVMFTQGQRARMRALLNAVRTTLVSQANLVSTGTNDGFVAPDCAPIAAFTIAPGTSANVCINTPVTLRDYSMNFTATGGPLTYSWSFPGGTPATAMGQTVSVSYANAGFYSVTETVSNTVGQTSSTQTNIIRVESPTGGEIAPLTESFETPGFPNPFAASSLRNYETSGTTAAGAALANLAWRRLTTATAADGTAYLLVSNRTYPAGATTTLITPNINLSGVPNPATLSFARSYALRTVSDNSLLRVSFSNNCGLTWSAPVDFTAPDLSTKGFTPINGFAPASGADWQTLTVPIPAQFQGSGLFKVRFQMVNGTAQGNNFFFDQLRVTSPLATRAESLASRGIAVYPNPLTRETAVHLTLAKATQIQVSLTDVLGRSVLTLPAKTYGAGQQTVSLQPAGGPALKAGLYLVRIQLDGEAFTSKLTVE